VAPLKLFNALDIPIINKRVIENVEYVCLHYSYVIILHYRIFLIQENAIVRMVLLKNSIFYEI
jgi:hypothetical protein